MSEGERDSTQDWQVPAATRPVTMHELERRVDVALAVAHSAEAAAVEIGAAAIDAAEQARRAAEFAERAVSGRSEPLELLAANRAEAGAGRNGVEIPDERLCLFSERADRVMTRLRALEPA
jgi:hypothetical protein